MKKLILAILLLATPLYADTPKPPTVAASKVDGLELPADQTVAWDEGFVTVKATCKGEVKWLPIAAIKIKFVPIGDNSVIISVPPQGGVINLFAVGLVDGHLTEFARTNITVTPPGPGPGPGPGPNPPPNHQPATSGYHVTLLVDLNQTNPQLAAILNSQNLRQFITTHGNFYRLYDIKSPIVAQKKFDGIVQRVGGSAIIVVQSGDGTVMLSQALPATEQEVIQLIGKATGGA